MVVHNRGARPQTVKLLRGGLYALEVPAKAIEQIEASKAEIPVWSLADLGASAPELIVKRSELMSPPARETAVEIIAGESPAEIADKLADKLIAEKVL